MFTYHKHKREGRQGSCQQSQTRVPGWFCQKSKAGGRQVLSRKEGGPWPEITSFEVQNQTFVGTLKTADLGVMQNEIGVVHANFGVPFP